MKEKEDLIKREILVVVPHPKLGEEGDGWTCLEDNDFGGKNDYKEI